jgi:demethoxyubiquinone hydroxylase (CLK1/Coq7/Cat5 family)
VLAHRLLFRCHSVGFDPDEHLARILKERVMAKKTLAANSTTTSDTNALNSLLRGEMSARETYDQAIEKLRHSKRPDLVNTLSRIRSEHAKAVETLRTHVTTHGGEPSEGFGAWGTFATAVEGAAKLLGPQTALAALKQGEQQGLNDYERTIQNEDMASDCKTLIRSELMPQTQEHIGALDRLMAELEQSGK